MSAVMLLTVALAAVNTLLALGLGIVYWRNHREIRSPFTLGLLLFALFLVVHNAAVVYGYVTMMDFYVGAGATFGLVESALQTAAIGALLVATLR